MDLKLQTIQTCHCVRSSPFACFFMTMYNLHDWNVQNYQTIWIITVGLLMENPNCHILLTISNLIYKKVTFTSILVMCLVQAISVDYTSTENNVEILHWCSAIRKLTLKIMMAVARFIKSCLAWCKNDPIPDEQKLIYGWICNNFCCIVVDTHAHSLCW